MDSIYETLSKYSVVDFDLVSEEYKSINATEYYITGVKLRIDNNLRIGFGVSPVKENDYKQEALIGALKKAYLCMPKLISTVTKEQNSDPKLSQVTQSSDDINLKTRYDSFLKMYNIDSEEKMLFHLKTWNNNIKAYNQVTKDMLEDFLNWVDSGSSANKVR